MLPGWLGHPQGRSPPAPRARRAGGRTACCTRSTPGPSPTRTGTAWATCRGPAWTLDEASGQYYLHNFLPEQPDLNWWNEEVREAFDDILRFWFDRGIAGFRIDVCNGIVKDRELRDNPPATQQDHWSVRVRGQRPVYSANRPEVHDVLRRWRKIADS